MAVNNEIKNFGKDSVNFVKQPKPENLEQVWPWGLKLVALLRPVAKIQGDETSVILYNQLEQACLEKNEANFDAALIQLNEQKKQEANRAYRLIKGGVRLTVRPFTNVLRKALGKKELKETDGL
jgi:hypothetical protein